MMFRKDKDIFAEDIKSENIESENIESESVESKDSTSNDIVSEDKVSSEDKLDEGEDSEKKAKKQKKNKNDNIKPSDINIVKELLNVLLYISIVILLCYVIINYVGCRSKVDGSSMNPTLTNGDSLWIDKLAYHIGDPKRFDVIVFMYDDDTSYVKRIIGLPGETVQIDIEGKIYINGQLLIENYGKEVIDSSKIGRAIQPVLLGEDEYFVMGDNRNNSSDSRYADVGNVSRESIVGKAVLRIYPFSSFGKIDK